MSSFLCGFFHGTQVSVLKQKVSYWLSHFPSLYMGLTVPWKVVKQLRKTTTSCHFPQVYSDWLIGSAASPRLGWAQLIDCASSGIVTSANPGETQWGWLLFCPNCHLLMRSHLLSQHHRPSRRQKHTRHLDVCSESNTALPSLRFQRGGNTLYLMQGASESPPMEILKIKPWLHLQLNQHSWWPDSWSWVFPLGLSFLIHKIGRLARVSSMC